MEKTASIGPVTPVYAAVSGEDAVYVLNSGEDLVFTVKRNVNDGSCFERFNQSEKGVEIDDSTLTRDTDYTAAKGSTIVTLKAATLNQLSEGKHTVTVNFNDGEAKISLTVKRASSPAPVPPVSYKIPITGVE